MPRLIKFLVERRNTTEQINITQKVVRLSADLIVRVAKREVNAKS